MSKQPLTNTVLVISGLEFSFRESQLVLFSFLPAPDRTVGNQLKGNAGGGSIHVWNKSSHLSTNRSKTVKRFPISAFQTLRASLKYRAVSHLAIKCEAACPELNNLIITSNLGPRYTGSFADFFHCARLFVHTRFLTSPALQFGVR